MKWVLVTVILLILAWRFELGMLVFTAYGVLLLLACGRGLALTWARQLSAHRTSTTAACQIGENAEITVLVSNDGPLKIPWLLLEDAVPDRELAGNRPRLSLQGAWMGLLKLSKGESQALQYQIQCHQRGYYQFGPILAETGDLFGLHRSYRLLTEPRFLMVYPKVLPLENYDIQSPRPLGEIRLAHRLFEDPTRIAGVRAFEHGDPISRIHWRASARTGVLQSKTFEPSCVAGATIVLDFHAHSFPAGGETYCSELGATLAATFARALAQMNQQVGLVSNGRDAVDRMKVQGWDLTFKTRSFARRGAHVELDNRRLYPVVVETRRDATQFQRILEALARLELTREYPFHEMIAEAGPRLPRSASLIPILSQITPETAAALGHLKRRGYSMLALVVTFGEQEHPDWAAPPQWAELLLQHGIPFRTIPDEAAVTAFCAECLV